MGKILFLADIHGNMPAIQALEQEIEKIQPDEIWFLGDAVGKGPENDQAVDWVRSHCYQFIKGNWDGYVCNTYRTGENSRENSFYCEQLGKERINWLENLPLEGAIGEEKPSAIRCEILSIPYDNQLAADIARHYPELPNMQAYQKEVLTGVYSR